MASSSYGVYEGVPLPSQCVEKSWTVSAPSQMVEAEGRPTTEYLSVIHSSSAPIHNPVPVEQHYHEEDDLHQNHMRRSNKVATYLSPAGIVTVKAHQELLPTVPGPASVAHIVSNRPADTRMHKANLYRETLQRPEQCIDTREHTHITNASRTIQDRMSSTRQSGRQQSDHPQLVRQARIDEEIAFMEAMPTTSETHFASNRQQLRLQQREKIKQEIEKRRELEPLADSDTHTLIRPVATAVTQTEAKSVQETVHVRQPREHQNGSFQEQKREKHVAHSTARREGEVCEHQSKSGSLRRKGSSHHKDKEATTIQTKEGTTMGQVKSPGSDSPRQRLKRIQERQHVVPDELVKFTVHCEPTVNEEPVHQSRSRTVGQANHKKDNQSPAPVREKPPKSPGCGTCGLNKKRQKPVFHIREASPARPRSQTRKTVTHTVMETTHGDVSVPKVYSQLDDDVSEEFCLQAGPIVNEKAHGQPSATMTNTIQRKTNVTEHKNGDNHTHQHKSLDDNSPRGCCIS